MLSRNPQSEFLGPDDLALCQRVFDQACADDNMDCSGVLGEMLASTVIGTFQRGFVNEADLLIEVRRRRDDLMFAPADRPDCRDHARTGNRSARIRENQSRCGPTSVQL